MDTSVQAQLAKELENFRISWQPGHELGREILERFVQLFVRRSEDSVLGQRSLRSLLTELDDSLRFISTRPSDEILIRVFNPPHTPASAVHDRTVLEINMGDQPFLLDTLRLYLRQTGLRELFCSHPILAVRRDGEGRIEDLNESTAGSPAESFIHLELEPVEEDKRKHIAAAVSDLMRLARAVCDDFSDMVKEVRDAVNELEYYASRLPSRSAMAEEGSQFLQWLIADHFVFLGFQDYQVSHPDVTMIASPVAGSGLGLAREEVRLDEMPSPRRGDGTDVISSSLFNNPFVLAEKAEEESKIHRPGKIDLVTVKRFSRDGKLIGFRNFLGLFTHQALEQPGSAVPMLREKLAAVLAQEGAREGSYSYKEVVATFDSIPLEYLFLSSPQKIQQDIRLILAAQVRNEIGLNLVRDATGRSLLVMLVLPPARYSPELREEVERYLADCCLATYSDHRVSFTEVEAAVVHFYFTSGSAAIPELDQQVLLEKIRSFARSWVDRLRAAMSARFSEPQASALLRRYSDAFPKPYQVSHPVTDTVCHIERLEELLESNALQVSLARHAEEESNGTLHLNLYGKAHTHLADKMPVLDNLGLRVLDHMATVVRPADFPVLYMDTFEIEDRWPEEKDLLPHAALIQDAIRAIFAGDVDNDSLNRLVPAARVGWREVDVLRAYLGYAGQIGSPFSREFYVEVLVRNVDVCLDLLALFDARFNPGLDEDQRGEITAARRATFEEALQKIENFNEDRVLRTLRSFVEATCRTNLYRRRAAPYFLALKMDGSKVEQLPLPRPAFELIVRGPQMEGVHLRCGKVARGGLRWSDRIEDYRTEILGLMKTQHVKNALIVPVGAKGGFVLKAKGLSPGEKRKLADDRYEIFIRGLLDVTDNLVDGHVEHPERVVVHDGDDPYLVVAADKGTAHLSDSANRISEEVGFWLGDAFASGGSHGYDHRKEGITAKGAWACIRRHFLEMGVDLNTASIRVLGIGDMSGDVFGNGMLLSRRMKLVAAFNHMHILLDPDPDPEASFRERERLFRQPVSTWEDYDKSVMSEGGGVFRRQAKAIPLAPGVKAMLGVDADVMGGEELIRSLLSAEFDLLWNGGIGTYIKASDETHLDVGDKANDSVRVDATEVRAKVVGEGGNLGITQRGRIELAALGVRINTDAIDNSAGVDLSDHEVNLKIGLRSAVLNGSLDFEARNRLLEEIDAEVCEAVTDHNWNQSRLLSLDALRSLRGTEEFECLIGALESEGKIHRESDGLPPTEVLLARRDSGKGLTRPELAVVLGHAKLDVYERLLASEFLQTPGFEPFFDAYFPDAMRRLDTSVVRDHPLRREITATQLANHVVDWAGTCFFRELIRETAGDAGKIAAAYVLAENALGAQALRGDLEATGFDAPVTIRYEAYLLIEDTLTEAVRWVLPSLGSPDRWQALSEEYCDLLCEARPALEGILSPSRRAVAEKRCFQLCEGGLPEEISKRVADFPGQLRHLEIGRIAREVENAAGWPLSDTGRLYFAIGEESQIDWLLVQMAEAPKPTEWDKIAYSSLRGELIRKQHEIAVRIIQASKPGERWNAAWDTYRTQNASSLERLAQDRIEVESARETRFTPYSVLGQLVKGLP